MPAYKTWGYTGETLVGITKAAPNPKHWVRVVCATCNKDFYKGAWAMRQTKGSKHYCSQMCYKAVHDNEPKTCPQCQWPIPYDKHRKGAGRNKFCSKLCRRLASKRGQKANSDDLINDDGEALQKFLFG